MTLFAALIHRRISGRTDFVFGVLSLVACMLLAACSSAPATKTNLSGASEVNGGIAITNVTVIDSESGVRENQTVVLKGDQIVSVQLATATTDRVAQVIDGTGKFLIPGLWDMHVHLTYDDRFVDLMPSTFIEYGITSVRDTGGMLENLLPVVKTMQTPGAIAPRVFFSGPLLDGSRVVYDGDSRPLIGISNDDESNARANVRAVKQAGASFIKVYELVSPQVFAALVDEANRLDLPIASHVPLSMTASTAGPKVDSIEHLRNIELDCASNWEELHETRKMKLANPEPKAGFPLRSGLHKLQRLPAIAALDEDRCKTVLSTLTSTFQVPTLRLNAIAFDPPFEQADWAQVLSKMPADVIADWEQPPQRFPLDRSKRDLRFAHYSFEMVARMKAAGVPIGAGTDTPIGLALPGYSLHRELEMLVHAGLTPLEALKAATVAPAAFLNIDEQMGLVKAGMKADLVLLDKNPLTNIKNTRSINTVISRGSIAYQNQ